MQIRSILGITSALVCLAAGPMSAQEYSSKDIDAQLGKNLDFRTLDFNVCFDEEECTVDKVTVSGFRRNDETSEWEPTTLYWDPIDGIGVLGGGQNDEVDFDEKIVVTFGEAKPVKIIWLTDLFIKEDVPYGEQITDPGFSNVEVVDPEYAEIAEIDLNLGDELVTRTLVTGELELPNITYNEIVSELFVHSGDLRNRVVIKGEHLTIRSFEKIIHTEVDILDEDKLAIFDEVTSEEREVMGDLLEASDAPIFGVGTVNADRIEALLNAPSALQQMFNDALIGRLTGDVNNGEVAAVFEDPKVVDSLTFLVPVDTSNDYSIAGLVFEEDE